MYKAVVNSIRTELATDIDATQTTIPVLNASALQDTKLAVIGSGEIAETIRYESIENNNLIGCERGFQGASKPWGLGTKIARNFTAYDHDTTIENINELHEQVQEVKQDIKDITPLSIGAETPTGAQLKADAGQTAAEQSAQGLADALQTNLDDHTNAKIYSSPVHGLRVENDKLQFEKSDGIWKPASSDIQLSDSITGTRSNVAATELAVSKVANRSYRDTTFIEATVTEPKTFPRYTRTVLNLESNKDSKNELNGSKINLTEEGTYYVRLYLEIAGVSGGSYVPQNTIVGTGVNVDGYNIPIAFATTAREEAIVYVVGGTIVTGQSTIELTVWNTIGTLRINRGELRVARLR